MFICVCKAVSDRHIQREVQGGVSTLRELTRNTGLGTCCGKCVPQAREVLVAATQAPDSPHRARDLPATYANAL